MKGEKVKKKLLDSGFKLKNIADSMGITPQTLQSLLQADDIKTGVLENIAKAINKNLYFFIEDNIDNLRDQSDSPDVLRVLIEEKDKLLKEKDERLRDKDEYIADLKQDNIRLREENEQLRRCPPASPGANYNHKPKQQRTAG